MARKHNSRGGQPNKLEEDEGASRLQKLRPRSEIERGLSLSEGYLYTILIPHGIVLTPSLSAFR